MANNSGGVKREGGVLVMSKRKKALITGITGQDGSYLAEFLLKKGYDVYGLIRRSSSFNTERIEHLYQDPHEKDIRLRLVYGDLNDASSLNRIVKTVRPDEIYNLGAQSHVKVSFEIPEYTAESVAVGTTRLLEAVRDAGIPIKFYQASSSEMFGLVRETPQKETTPFYPRSPYAAAKVYAYWMTVNYREAYNIFACNGILFNHESPRRGETFVTRKITRGLARIKHGLQDKLFLGNLESKRDWGFAGDYVEAMWLMLQQKRPMIMLSRRERIIPLRNFSSRLLVAWGWIGRSMLRLIHVIFDRRKLMLCSETVPRRVKNSIGNQR